jgi:peptidoglycan hydrolase-like protein with peptidoglycan-binding domain
MRSPRLILAAALAAGLAAAAPAGASNPQHAGLQVALRAQGLYLGPIDGVVGPATVRAARAFQRREGLPATGLADARTRRALGPLGRPLFGTRTLRPRAFGWDVAVLQFLLVRQGFAAPVNGYLDPPTLRALRAYQRALRLVPDGIAGPRTIAALELQRRVPAPATLAARRTTTATTSVYVVKPGDSLTRLAARFGTTVAALARLNRLDPSRYLLIGRRLRVPLRPAVAATATPVEEIRASLGHWASVYGVDPSLVRALAWMESGFQQRVVSSVGAQGVMQLLPSTWTYVENVLIGRPVEHTADGNVHVGVAYLSHLLHVFGGDEHLALAAWYQGERAVRTHGVYNQSRAFVADVLALRTRM